MSVNIVEIGDTFFLVVGKIWLNTERIAFINTDEEGDVIVELDSADGTEDFSFKGELAQVLQAFLEAKVWT